MTTFRLITDQAVEDGCADLLPLYEQYMRDFRQSVACKNGWTVLPRIVMQPGESLMSLRGRILAAGACDYNDLMGDSIPFPVLHEFPFGHVPDAVPGDGVYFAPGTMTIDSANVVTSKPDADPFGAFGRIGPFNVESTDTRTSTQKYRDWLTDQMNPLPWMYAPEVDVDDHFAYAPYADIGIGARSQIPAGWTVHEMVGLTETGDNNDFQDGEWPIIAARPVLCNINLDGGFWNRLYNTGSSKDWRAANPGAYLEVIFGSEQDEFWSDDNLMVTAISTPYCNCCYIDWWGQEQLHLFFAGWPVGAVQRALGYYAKKMYGTIQGSCTHMLLDAQLALVAMQQDLSDLKTWKGTASTQIAALQAQGVGSGGGSGSGVGGPPPPLSGRINIGGPLVTDAAGDWAAAVGSVGSPLAQRVQAIDMTGCPGVPLTVMQTGWYSGVPVTYTIGGLTPGQHTLRLYFAETFSSARTQRVTIGGQVALDNFNIASAAGGMNRAVYRDLLVTVGADGVLSFTVMVVSGDPNSWICGASVL